MESFLNQSGNSSNLLVKEVLNTSKEKYRIIVFKFKFLLEEI